ncbi:DUF3108 domain-containing protein [Candidatus Aerophobetes bacterium]|uniref:DUF3108 domain-containing protein n=1 Tax=Aerophobetes bacterium TaxID=2030807 RepID=A0A523RSZ1_UNCAE|nr:MAG: DUF3108 domain-containing protein [Candidatus Aerophobetes bacterium]
MRRKKMKRMGLVLCLFLFFVISSGRVGAYPFKLGEKLIYTIEWSGAPLLLKVLAGKSVGKLVLEAEELTQTNGQPAYLFSWELRTAGIYSLLFPIDERRESYVDIDTFCPYKVTICYKEGKDLLKDWVIEIDQKTGEALIRDKKNGQEETRFLSLPVFDIPSLIYWLRTQELEVENVFSLFLLEDVKTKTGKEEIKEEKVQIKVVRKKEIYIRDKPYLTLLCEEVGSEKIKVWFSADERYLPVKIEVDVGEGTLIASLDEGKSIF